MLASTDAVAQGFGLNRITLAASRDTPVREASPRAIANVVAVHVIGQFKLIAAAACCARRALPTLGTEASWPCSSGLQDRGCGEQWVGLAHQKTKGHSRVFSSPAGGLTRVGRFGGRSQTLQEVPLPCKLPDTATTKRPP